ncbi:MAG: hypothetical protein JO058_12095, partial [Alphaproteobacteria bacterium]|nr:hypothetical protein [Alphaproteobacteria bacterium]
YLLVGSLPDGIGIDEALWTIIFPDHALGRLFERSRPTDPIATMLTAHRNALKARVADLMPNFFGATREFYLPSCRGVFICQLFGTQTPVRGQDQAMFVFARTWLDNLDLRDDQLPIAVDAADGEDKMGDSFLLPLPLRRIFLP